MWVNCIGRKTFLTQWHSSFLVGLGRFYMDYTICEKLRLIVDQMKEAESDTSKDIVNTLGKYTSSGVICKKVRKGYRIPFIILYGE